MCSFLAPAASGAYLFLYSVYYFKTRLFITDSTSIMLYFGYMFLISTVFSLITGTVGYLSTFVFVRKIYAAIKVRESVNQSIPPTPAICSP